MTDHKLDFAERLNIALSSAGFPERGRAAELAKKFNVSPKAAGKWVKGEAIPEMEKLIGLSIWLKRDVQWLLSGNSHDTGGRFSENVDISPIATTIYAPVISWVQAGIWTDMEAINLEDCEMLPLVPGAGKRSFYLKVKGTSNSPEFEDGEHICIDPDYCLDDIQTGEMVVVRCEGTATFKALIVETNGFFLKPLNPNWEPQVMPLDEKCELVGKYVGSFKPARRYFFN